MAKPPQDLTLIHDEDDRAILDRAKTALRRINAGRSWDDWMSLLDAMKIITLRAVEQAKSGPWHRNNKSAVRMFNGLWEHWEREEEAESQKKEYKPLSSSERTQLRFIMDHPEIEVWRNTLDATKRRKFNHPNFVVNEWRRTTQTPDEETARKAKKKDDVVVELEHKLAEAEKQLRHAKRDAEWIAPENLAKAEEAIVARLANASIIKKIEAVKRVASRVGIRDVAKLLATKKPGRKRTHSQE